MAAISTGNVTVLSDEGYGDRVVLYRIHAFNSGDTLDVSGRFAGAPAVGTGVVTGSTALITTSQTTAGVVTLTLAGTTSAAAYLLVRGPSA